MSKNLRKIHRTSSLSRITKHNCSGSEQEGSNNQSSSRHIRQNIRELVWNTHIGQRHGTAWCFCCRATLINPFRFECGHIKARAKGGLDSVDNLRPICGLCNRSMGTMNMLEFQRQHNLPIKSYYYSKFSFLVLLSLLTLLFGYAVKTFLNGSINGWMSKFF